MDPSLSAAGATPTPVLADSKLKIKPFMTSSCPVDKGIICSHFLSDAWCPVVNCPFAHVAASARRAVPQVVCPQWLTARCTNDACPHYHHTQERLNRLHEAGATDYLVVDGAPVRDPMDQETPLTAAQLCGVVPPIGSVAAPVPTLLAPSPIAMMSPAAAPPQHPQPMAPQTVLPNPPAYKSIPPPPAYQAAVGRPQGTPTQRPAPPPYASTPKAVMQPVTMVPSPVLAPPGAPMYQPTAYAQPQPMAYPGMPMYMVPTQMPTAPPGYMMVSNQYGQPAYALAPSYGAAPGMPVLQMAASPMMPAMVPQAPPGYAYAAPPPMVYPQ